MPYLHLPVQSGSNVVLKKMNRKYTTEFYLDIIDKYRKLNIHEQPTHIVYRLIQIRTKST